MKGLFLIATLILVFGLPASVHARGRYCPYGYGRGPVVVRPLRPLVYRPLYPAPVYGPRSAYYYGGTFGSPYYGRPYYGRRAYASPYGYYRGGVSAGFLYW